MRIGDPFVRAVGSLDLLRGSVGTVGSRSASADRPSARNARRPGPVEAYALGQTA